MKHILPFKPFCRPTSARRFSFLRRPILRALSLLLFNGALVQVANAQASGAPAAQPRALYSLLSTLSIFAFLALLFGLFRPKTFAFLFKEKATRGRVCATFGAAWFFLSRAERTAAPQTGRDRNHVGASDRGGTERAKRRRVRQKRERGALGGRPRQGCQGEG